MITFMVRKEQIDYDYSLQELQEFSKKYNTRIIVPRVLTMEKGIITWIN